MKEKIKIGYVGTGRRGNGLLMFVFREMDDIEIVTLCDTNWESMEAGRNFL